MLTGLSLGIPYIGVVAGTLLFFAGHTFDVAVSMLGAGVHALRLNYVEFFSKFYEGGGNEYKPLKPNRKYTKLRPES